MIDDRETWWASLVTASSFLGLVVALLCGGIAALSCGSWDPEYLAVGGLCGVAFFAHLRLA